jgi:nitrous oxide reductase accessory protein NosL
MKKLLLMIVCVATLFGAPMEISKDASCLIRNIKLYTAPEWAASIQVRSGKIAYFSSPKSMFEFYFQPGKWPEYNVKSEDDMRIHVTNFNTLEKIPAKEAFFVYGSSKISPAGDDLPAFSTKQEAETFSKKYNGSRVMDFSQVSDGLINLLNGRTR